MYVSLEELMVDFGARVHSDPNGDIEWCPEKVGSLLQTYELLCFPESEVVEQIIPENGKIDSIDVRQHSYSQSHPLFWWHQDLLGLKGGSVLLERSIDEDYANEPNTLFASDVSVLNWLHAQVGVLVNFFAELGCSPGISANFKTKFADAYDSSAEKILVEYLRGLDKRSVQYVNRSGWLDDDSEFESLYLSSRILKEHLSGIYYSRPVVYEATRIIMNYQNIDGVNHFLSEGLKLVPHFTQPWTQDIAILFLPDSRLFHAREFNTPNAKRILSTVLPYGSDEIKRK